MHQKQYNPGTDSEMERNHTGQIVQLLKNDVTKDQSSDESNELEMINENPLQHKRKTKKSFFATLIKKRSTKQSKVRFSKEIQACSTINFGIETQSSDQELSQYQFTSKNFPDAIKEKKSFLKQVIKHPALKNNSSNKHSLQLSESKTVFDSFIRGKRVLSRVLTLNNFVVTSYLPKLNRNVVNGMNELQDILQHLQHSEEHLIYILIKYIQDKNLQTQLMNASSEYFTIHHQSTSQVHILADKLWTQQLEIAKSQESCLQKRLEFLVKTNRNLEFQTEALYRQCEKLADKTNLYPKRFLHLRSFGKVYARQLIDNNRRLQNKVKCLTEVIGTLEDELDNYQQQEVILEEERKELKSQVGHLEDILRKQKHESELEKSEMKLESNNQRSIINEAIVAAQYIFQDLQEFYHSLREFSIVFTWNNTQPQDACLPEMFYQARACIREFFMTIITAYKSLIVIANDVNKLRNTNARLQENLQKSTNELDNLSKKLETKAEVDVNALEKVCKVLEEENFNLKLKIENVTEHNIVLREQLEIKKSTLLKAQSNIDEILKQNQNMLSHIDRIVQTISNCVAYQTPKQFSSNEDKLEYLTLHCNQLVIERKELIERCNNLEADNQVLLEAQETYNQNLTTLRDGLTFFSSENDTLKKQLSLEHQTITTLQNERIKYLEERNILKTVFQHVKSEIARIHQLEGAVSDMSKETNRLSLIAEFNKQLGEQLKTEIEVKENTIMELKQSLEKLSHLQLDSDKEKMTLTAQLSEIACVKDKLTNCLEIELKKNMQLDESKRKLENNTKDQLKLYEEMQRNERAALKELLKDFKNLIKQRDFLVQLQEDSKKKYKDLEKRYSEIKKQYESAISNVMKREEQLNKMEEKLQTQTEKYQQLEENHNSEVLKNEKSLRRIEKLLGQMRNEKKELETSNTHLQNNLQKIQSELNDLRNKESVSVSKLSAKTTECEKLESEIKMYKNELQLVNQENGKMTVELEYLKKMHQQHTNELNDTISKFSAKDSMYLQSQNSVLTKEQQISELNKLIIEKETDNRKLENECNFMKKQIEDQNKIMIGYENQLVLLQDIESSKLKVEKDMINIQAEHKAALQDLENSRKEIDCLKSEIAALVIKDENEKSFYKKQISDILNEYSEHKISIEREIDLISSQLRNVTENLNSEKVRFEELTIAHEDLKVKYGQIKDKLNAEISAHKETLVKTEGMGGIIHSVAAERENLQQRIQELVAELNKEAEKNIKLSNENKQLQTILDQGRQQYKIIVNKNTFLQEELEALQQKTTSIMNSKETSRYEVDSVVLKFEEKQAELISAQDTIENLQKDLDESRKELIDLKEDFFKLQQQVTGLEFKNCELTLQLHETQTKLETERNLYEKMKARTAERGDISSLAAPSNCGELFY